VLWADGGTETTRENNQDWLQLDEEEPGFQLLTEEEIAAVIFFYLFLSALPKKCKAIPVTSRGGQ
jgi:hypothetical protein